MAARARESTQARGYFECALHQQAAVGGATDEREAEIAVELGVVRRPDQNSAGLAVLGCGPTHLCGALQELRCSRPAVDAERVGQINRANEENINPVEGGDLADVS